MLYYNFQGVEGFKKKYYANNGKKKIILAYAKSQMAWELAKNNNNYQYLDISDMNVLKREVLNSITIDPHGDIIELCGYTMYSDKYQIDDRRGVCEDGDVRSIRYYNIGKRQTFKMKAGKFFRMVVLESKYGKIMPAPVLTWLCEEFARDWAAYAQQYVKNYTLHYGDSSSDFERIYTRDDLKGDFHSCMMDEDYYDFYTESVDATAAWLEDEDGDMVARCVIYNKVLDQDGKEWRLAERQYSSDQDETLKVSLVNALIQEGLIDGYKRVGADCHDERNFVDINGNSLRDKRFKIHCNLDYDEHVSYQDSFKYFDYDSQMAYNYSDACYSHDLAVTNGCMEDDRNYDDYHGRHTTSSVVQVYYDGRWMSCADDDLDDFEEIDGDYYHNSLVSYCDECDEAYVTKNGYHSELTGEDYCCSGCKRKAEERYASEHDMVYCEDSGKYEERENVTAVMEWDGYEFIENYYTTECVKEDEFPQLGRYIFRPKDFYRNGCFEAACNLSGIKITQNL